MHVKVFIIWNVLSPCVHRWVLWIYLCWLEHLWFSWLNNSFLMRFQFLILSSISAREARTLKLTLKTKLRILMDLVISQGSNPCSYCRLISASRMVIVLSGCWVSSIWFEFFHLGWNKWLRCIRSIIHLIWILARLWNWIVRMWDALRRGNGRMLSLPMVMISHNG